MNDEYRVRASRAAQLAGTPFARPSELDATLPLPRPTVGAPPRPAAATRTSRPRRTADWVVPLLAALVAAVLLFFGLTRRAPHTPSSVALGTVPVAPAAAPPASARTAPAASAPVAPPAAAPAAPSTAIAVFPAATTGAISGATVRPISATRCRARDPSRRHAAGAHEADARRTSVAGEGCGRRHGGTDGGQHFGDHAECRSGNSALGAPADLPAGSRRPPSAPVPPVARALRPQAVLLELTMPPRD